MKRSRLLPPLLLPVLFFFTACFPPGTTPVRFALQVTVEGEGQVYPNSGTFTKDLLLDFDIRPANGWEFSNWKGQNQYEVVQNDNRWYLKMNGDKSLIAVFERIDNGSQPGTYSLSVNTLGGGTVYPNSGRFPANQILKLDVRPENGWAFDRWEGPNRADVYGSNNNFSINMNGDKILIAVFQEDSCKLSISVTGKGKVEEKLLGADYAKGSMVRLTAMADAG